MEYTKGEMIMVKKYRSGLCYACVWVDASPMKIKEDIRLGAIFYPYDESTGTFLLGNTKGRRFSK